MMNSHLTSSQRAALRTALQQREQALQRQLADHLHGLSRVERAHDVAQQDNDDAPQRVPEREVALALTDHEQAELNAVSDALKRIDSDAYGVCVDCDARIPFARLNAEPWARRCVACETKRENARG